MSRGRGAPTPKPNPARTILVIWSKESKLPWERVMQSADSDTGWNPVLPSNNVMPKVIRGDSKERAALLLPMQVRHHVTSPWQTTCWDASYVCHGKYPRTCMASNPSGLYGGRRGTPWVYTAAPLLLPAQAPGALHSTQSLDQDGI